jgi:hypothetical protein
MRKPLYQKWRIGDRVRFAHEHPKGPVHVVSAVSHVLGETFAGDPMVELRDMAGEFGSHLFIAAGYEPNSIVPGRERGQ